VTQKDKNNNQVFISSTKTTEIKTFIKSIIIPL